MSSTLFKNVPSKVGDLVHDVMTGRIGLPDLQRPFVWKDNKVRELLDSMIKEALNRVMNLNNWHAFINIVAEAGYISEKQIASSNAIVFSYVLYLIAKYDYGLDAMNLKKCISKWFFMSAITYFYTGSTESEVERQFADLRNVRTAEEFIYYIDGVISTHFTDDYFNYTLPNELNTAAGISPSWNGYIASQIVLNVPMLFSNTPISKYFILGASYAALRLKLRFEKSNRRRL